MTFHVGQKVVCADAAGEQFCWGEAIPAIGEVYTIRDIRPSRYTPGEFAVRLDEIRNAPQVYANNVDACECWFMARYFRPIIERKTDISFAHEILRKVTRKDRVKA